MARRHHLVGLVGSGVGPSLTPPLHMAEGRALGMDYVYRTIDLTARALAPEQIGEILQWARLLGFDALNITHPCKQSVIEHLDHVDEVAGALGAVNTVLFTDRGDIGYNTDTTGFATAFGAGLPGVSLADVVVLGAGGAGAAVADAMLRLGTDRLTVVDIDLARADSLAAELSTRHQESVTSAGPGELSDLLPTVDGVVHCTPTGMADHPGTPFDPVLLRPELWIADIVYRPLNTALLAAGRAAGCRVLDGGQMAVHQAVDAFALITGVTPDAARMARNFRDLVAPDET